MYQVDLNSDLGESFGNYTLEANDEIMRHVSSANVACGLHAGDPVVMAHTVALAKEYGVGVGAHPSYPDLQGFGRRRMIMKKEELRDFITYQIGALYAFTKAAGVPLLHISAHGALGNVAQADMDTARAVCEATASFDDSIRILYYGGCSGPHGASNCILGLCGPGLYGGWLTSPPGTARRYDQRCGPSRGPGDPDGQGGEGHHLCWEGYRHQGREHSGPW